MRACSTVNATLGIALVVAFAFAGCSGQKPTPATPTTTPSAQPEAKSDGDKAGGGAKGGADDETGTKDDETGTKDDGDKAGGGAKGDGDEPEKRTTEVIAGVVQDNRKPFRECYDKARKQVPDLEGMMTIHFVLDPDGKLKKAELNQERSTLKSPDVVKCAIEALKKLKFPPSSRGMESTINYPFNFKPDGGGAKK